VWKDIDCIEVFNAREAFTQDNVRAAVFAKEKGLPGAVGSDAHRAQEIGRAWVEVAHFAGRDDFIAALREGSVIGKLTGNYIHVLTRLDVIRKWWYRRRAKSRT
jgi:predicted metal-dependent phosphoesterase TrpH